MTVGPSSFRPRSSKGANPGKSAAGVRAVRAGRAGESGEGDDPVDAGTFERNPNHLPNDCVGALERGAVRQLDGDDRVTLVERGNESDRHAFKGEEREHEQERVNDQGEPAAPDEPANRRHINADGLPEEFVKAAEEPAENRCR